MSEFRTEIHTKPHRNRIEYDSKAMFIGSCFANNIGEKFAQSKIPCLINPYGVIYNPVSVNNTLKLIIDNYSFTEDDIRQRNGHWHSLSHHSSFNDVDKQTYIDRINDTNKTAHQFLKQADYVFITFGTAWVYQYIENSQIVSNCHKYPNKEFNRFLLNIEEIIEVYKKIITELLVFNPTINIVFTVSPVRHWKDGAHGNQISKATLLLAIEQIVDIFENCTYFPAYEFVLDDLRDYRFFNADMIHPNQVAVNYIWKKFEDHFFSNKALQYQKEMAKLVKSVAHRPFDVKSNQHQDFLRLLLQKLKTCKQNYPNADLNREITEVEREIL